jgi:hypothetical protein
MTDQSLAFVVHALDALARRRVHWHRPWHRWLSRQRLNT